MPVFHNRTLKYIKIYKSICFLQAELAKGLGFGELSKSEVLKTYMLDKAYQAVRERTPDLGYTFLVRKRPLVENPFIIYSCFGFIAP